MGLFVKWGGNVKIAEGQCLYALRRVFDSAVPVPEVYGWRTEGDFAFIYMELLKGQTLEQVWDNLDVDNRILVSQELRVIFDNMRVLEQDAQDPFIGNISRGIFSDRVIHVNFKSEAGPFASVKEFHEWFSILYRRDIPGALSLPADPQREELPDTIAIKFTHGDIHRSNIMLTLSEPKRVLAIVDLGTIGLVSSLLGRLQSALLSLSRKRMC